MNTKTTSYKWAHNFYDGGNHALGRDSPGALLDMLAEVASQTLHSETIRLENDSSAKSKPKADRRKNQEVILDLPQIMSMPLTQLVKHFTIFTSDELKRQYSYTCALVPGCQQKYTSFASEGKARISITTHLQDHLDHLRSNKDFDGTFRASAVKYTKPKSGPQSKKIKVQQCNKQKSQEIPNKENKLVKSEKSTSYLRKILCNEMNFKEFEREKRLEENDDWGRDKWKMDIKNKSDVVAELKVLGDHSYYEHSKRETDKNAVVDNDSPVTDNITLMEVQDDDKNTEDQPCVSEDTACHSNLEHNFDYNEATTVTAKPKGKAKFIGTSKEEREMALLLMERIKKKGNPTGSNLQCRICDPPRSFTAPTTLVSHYRSHAGIKPYECRICRSVFTRRHSLKYHMLIHQNQTRFTCADCGKKFRHPSHFREHRRRHTGESPFGCEDCGQRFKTRNTYKRHLKTRHGKVLTTTGELLCLTAEEFRKVQTNRKRKSPSISSDYLADEDATAAGTIVEFVDQAFTNEMENHENNNETMCIEDYAMQEEIFVSANEDSIKMEKTENIRTERMENVCAIVDEEEDDEDDEEEEENEEERILYDDIVVEDQLYDSPIDGREEFVDDDSSRCVLLLDNIPSTRNDENNDYNENNAPIEDENSPIIPDCEKESVGSNALVEDENDGGALDDNDYNQENDSEVTEYYNGEEFEYSNDNRAVNQQNSTETRVNVQYAYEIHENVQHYELTSQEIVHFEDNLTANDHECAISDKSISCRKNENNDVIHSNDLENSHDFSSSTRKIVVPANSTFLVIANDDLRSGYFRIENDDIVVKEVTPLSSVSQ